MEENSEQQNYLDMFDIDFRSFGFSREDQTFMKKVKNHKIALEVANEDPLIGLGFFVRFDDELIETVYISSNTDLKKYLSTLPS